MKIKCGRRVFEVTSKDRILDNGACYQLITQTYNKGFNTMIPVVSKRLFKTLKKDGAIRLSTEKRKGYYGESLDLYEFIDGVDRV